MKLKLLIIQYKDILNQNDLTVLYGISNNQEKYANYSLVELASEFHLSKSYIFKLTQKIGFSGYSEFKFFLKQAEKADQSVTQNEDSLGLLMKDIEETKKLLLQFDFTHIIQAIYSAKRVFCFGTGRSQQTILRQLSKNLFSSGKLVIPISSIPEFDVATEIMREGDMLIVASVSGETKDVKDKLDLIKFKKVRILSITHFNSNSIANLSDYNLFYQSTPIAISSKTINIYSFTPMELTLDILLRKYVDYLNSISLN